MTVALLIIVYAGYHIVRERSIDAGLHTAPFATNEDIAARNRLLKAAMLQAELRQEAASEALTNQLVQVALTTARGAARIWLGVIHNGVTGLTGISLLKFDITNAISAPGRSPGELVQDEPLSSWSDFLPQMLSGKCAMMDITKLVNSPNRDRLLRLGVAALLACPVVDIRNQVLGALFVQWDTSDTPPAPAAMTDLQDRVIAIGTQIASALDLRPQEQMR